MKIILSRKGFDSSAGGVASPITPSSQLVSLPIPDPLSSIKYRQLIGRRPSIARWASVLSRGRVSVDDGVHLDPDLDTCQLLRQSEWRAAFGQAGSALGHLDAQGVAEGDLFLFFGWFRQVEKHLGQWRYLAGAPDLHVFYGWLAVGEIWRQHDVVPDSIRLHVHTQRSFRGRNAIYIAADRWRISQHLSRPGAGLWSALDSRLVLSDRESRSQWKLPAWFNPSERESCLSYHQNPARWSCDGQSCRLQAAARGQEFVLNCDHYPEALGWAAGLIALADQAG